MEDAAAEVTDAPAKPKRSRKTAEPAPEEASEAEAVEAPEKPKRSRKKAEPAAEAGTEAGEGDEA